MWDLFLQGLFFVFGIFLGKAQAVNQDITKQTEYMQDLIDIAYQERDAMKVSLIRSQENAESWQRRYDSLIEYIYKNEDEEEEVGS